MRTSNATNIAYAGVCVSLAVMSIVLGGYFSVVFSFLPMIICPLSFFVVFFKSGIVVWLISIASTGVLCFFLLGALVVPIVEFAIIIAPYSILVVLINRLDYSRSKILWRVLTMLGFSAIVTVVSLVFAKVFEYDLQFEVSGVALYIVVYATTAFVTVALDYCYTKVGAIIYPKVLKTLPKINVDKQGRDDFDIFE